MKTQEVEKLRGMVGSLRDVVQGLRTAVGDSLQAASKPLRTEPGMNWYVKRITLAEMIKGSLEEELATPKELELFFEYYNPTCVPFEESHKAPPPTIECLRKEISKRMGDDWQEQELDQLEEACDRLDSKYDRAVVFAAAVSYMRFCDELTTLNGSVVNYGGHIMVEPVVSESDSQKKRLPKIPLGTFVKDYDPSQDPNQTPVIQDRCYSVMVSFDFPMVVLVRELERTLSDYDAKA